MQQRAVSHKWNRIAMRTLMPRRISQYSLACDIGRAILSAAILPATILTVSLPATAAAAESRPAADPPDWWTRARTELRSKHHRVLGDVHPDEARLLVAHLDLFHEAYARRLAFLTQPGPTTPLVLVFRTETDYRDVLRTRYGVTADPTGATIVQTPDGTALALVSDGRPRVSIERLIQNQGFHQFTRSRLGHTLPPWAEEGLAETFGAALVIDGRVILGHFTAEPLALLRRAIDQGTTIPFTRLLSMTREDWDANRRAGGAAMQQLQAWSMIEFLGSAQGGRHHAGFERYLRLVHAGTPGNRAFDEAFGANEVANFERAWIQWVGAARGSALAEAAARLTFLAEGLRLLAREGTSIHEIENLSELTSLLQERRFTLDFTAFGQTNRLAASEDMLSVPALERDGATCTLKLVPLRAKPIDNSPSQNKPDHPTVRRDAPTRSSGHARGSATVTPPALSTDGLAPRELSVEWTRLPKSEDFAFRLTRTRAAPERHPRRNPDAPNGEPSTPDSGQSDH
jgi:hypothetical protein